MKAGPVKEHIQQVSTRMCYTRDIRIDDPYRLLAMAVILQAALDVINYYSPRVYQEFLTSWDAYAEMCRLDISPEQYLNCVRNNIHKWCDGRIQHHATAYIFTKQMKKRKE